MGSLFTTLCPARTAPRESWLVSPAPPLYNRDLPPLASLPQHVKPFKLQQLPALPSHLEARPLASAPRHAQSPQTPA